MKKAVLILVVFCALFSGCVQPPSEELPADFELEYGSGAMHAEWGQYRLEMDSEGNAVFEKTAGIDQSKKYEFVASEAERKKIYDAAVVNGFFSLNDKYEDPTIMDGGWSEINIRANGETKTVTVYNSPQPQFEAVEAEISRLIISKQGEDAFSVADLVD